MAKFKGNVVLVVNTATGCGFTPHYEKLEQMYEKFHEKGFEIVDVPCNQFANQTPGSDEEISEFCALHYNTQFAQMKKSDVNGQNELALFKFLKSKKGFAGFDECELKEKNGRNAIANRFKLRAKFRYKVEFHKIYHR